MRDILPFCKEERVEKIMGNGYTNQEVIKIKGERRR
jgi:hypothetical protein